MVIKHPQNIAELAECGGGSADVYRGEYGGRLVAVKFIRICLRDDRGLELSVGTPFRALREKTALTPTLIEILSRSRHLEASATSKRYAVAWRDVGHTGTEVHAGVRMDG